MPFGDGAEEQVGDSDDGDWRDVAMKKVLMDMSPEELSMLSKTMMEYDKAKREEFRDKRLATLADFLEEFTKQDLRVLVDLIRVVHDMKEIRGLK